MAIIGSPNKPKWVENWLNIVEHCQTHPGGSVRTFSAPRKYQLGTQKRPKVAFLGPKWTYFAIGSPSSPRWAEYWLNMIEHCNSHPGGSGRTLSAPRKYQRGPQKRPKMAFLGPKWTYFAIGSPSSPIWVQQWMNIVFHIREGQLGPVMPSENVKRGPKWPYLAIGSPRSPKWGKHCQKMVKH